MVHIHQQREDGGSYGTAEILQAIHLAPDSALLHASRGAAYLKRDWLADTWAALQDCETAIRLDPCFAKAHCRRLQALVALDQLQVHNHSKKYSASARKAGNCLHLQHCRTSCCPMARFKAINQAGKYISCLALYLPMSTGRLLLANTQPGSQIETIAHR